ncbi:MAG: hypothetical protein ACRC2R_14665 [Xenococcaceae cyanobacterium]
MTGSNLSEKNYVHCYSPDITLELTSEDLEHLEKQQQCFDAEHGARHLKTLENIYSGLNKKSSGLL